MSDLPKTVSDDSLSRFIFDGADIRGEIVTLADSYAAVLANNPAPVVVQQLLGEFLAAAALLSSTLKFDGIITLQAQGDGPVPVIMAECNHHLGLRGTVRPPEQGFADGLAGDLGQLIGHGVLAITIDPDKGERYQGVVPLDKPTLAACLEAYFAQSEQLGTRIWLEADNSRAAGLLIQALPTQLAASIEDNQAQWDTVIALAGTVTQNELLSLDHSSNLYRLFNEMQVRVFEPAPLQFQCTCSEQRSLSALAQIGREECEEILSEQGLISIDCQFCNQHYAFDAAQIRALFEGSPPTMH